MSNKIITIGREFGSGGREFGKLLAQELGVAYYDGEIVTAIAERSELAESYVNQVLEQKIQTYYPITVANTLAASPGEALYSVTRSIYTAQTDILREMAQKSDCVIVGRCADHILEDMRPFRLFLNADMESKVARCRAKGETGDSRSQKELERNIRNVDKARAQYYHFYTGQTWGEKLNYDLCLNTTGVDLKIAAEVVAAMVRAF